MKKITLFLCLFLINACQRENLEWGIAKKYFPSADQLSEGIVNKYYIHTQKKDKKQISTDIEYRSFQTIGNQLHIKRFLPNFKSTVERQFKFQNNQMILLKEIRIAPNRDTFEVTLKKPININWEANNNESERTIHFKKLDVNIRSKQIEIKDTTIAELPAKIIIKEAVIKQYDSSDTSTYLSQSQNIYVEGLGDFYNEYKNKQVNYWEELVEQIPLKEFEQMANQERHRVAYIDPSKALDQDDSFQTCHPIHEIYDYYNGQKKINCYKGGKKEIWKIVNQLQEEEKLYSESGYLTFRFVVNCKGEIGRVIAEQADLDFQRKQFNEATINHFYHILQQLTDWIPIKNRNKDAVDAYHYLTFKLKEGKLIEILP